MQRILIVSTKGISSHSYDGAQKRIFDIAKFLSKKNNIDFACIEDENINTKKDLKFINNIKVFKNSFFLRILYSLISIFKMEPMQKGYFFSKKMLNFISDNKDNYDVIIFHLIRSAQYLPEDFHGKTILEMTDLGSENYNQIIKQMSIFNPFYFLYLLEKFLLRAYEKKICNNFDKVVFISKNELPIVKDFIEKDKIVKIGSSVKPNKKIYRYKKNNRDIIFVGNINYLPNKLACYNFSRKILPKLIKKNPDLKFNIIGKINSVDKFFLKINKNVEVHGPILKLDKIMKKALCGVCNLSIATGVQNKIFTYMSFGLPTIVSKNCLIENLTKNKEILVYANNEQFIKHISELMMKKKTAQKISKNGFKALKKKFNLIKSYANYSKII